MPRKLEWFPWYPWRWVASVDVQLMPPSARGYYVTLLSQQWVRMESAEGGGLPEDPAAMFVLAGGRDLDDWGEQWPAHLEDLFPLCDDGERRNHTLAEVWLKQRKRTKAMSADGVRGAAVRWGLQLQMGTPSVANAYASTSISIQQQLGANPDSPSSEREKEAAIEAANAAEKKAIAFAIASDWLRELPRAAADKIRQKMKTRLKEELKFPDDWDLRKLGAITAPARASILIELHKESQDGVIH